MRIFTLFLTSCLVMFAVSGSAQQNELKFDYLTSDNGLSQSNVVSILQDSRGFMWIGTEDGLNKYDGYKMTVYLKDLTKKNSLSNNAIKDMAEDSFGNIWIATSGGGLNRYDRKKDQFIAYLQNPGDAGSIPGNSLSALVIDRFGKIWIGTQNDGISCLDPATNKFTSYKNESNDSSSLSDNKTTCLLIDDDDNIWVGTQAGGINIFDRKKKSFVRMRRNAQSKNGLNSDKIWSLFKDSRHNIWIGTNGEGVNSFDTRTGKFASFKHDDKNKKSLCNNVIMSITEDLGKNIWIGTENGGISKFDPSTGVFINYYHSVQDVKGLSDNAINRIYTDRRGNIWIGTFRAGINILSPDKNQFTHYRHTGSVNSLGNNNILSIYEDTASLLWIGTDGGGVNSFDRKSGDFTHYTHQKENNKSICGNFVLSVTGDSYGNLWFGTWGDGASMFNRKNNTWKHFRHNPKDPGSLRGNNVWFVFEDTQKDMWLGQQGAGLSKYDRATGSFIHYTSENSNLTGNNVLSIFEDSDGYIWIGTDGEGLNRLDKKTNIITQFRASENKSSLSGDVVNCIYEDFRHNFWIGTNQGLNLYDRKNNTFSSFHVSDGLPNESIFAILEDNKSNLWISANKGLSKFRPSAKTFLNFGVSDGLQANEFKQANCKSRSGAMYFGGINGFNEFYPDSIKETLYDAPLAITDFLIFNHKVPVALSDKDPSPLKSVITETSSLTLPYQSSVISFEYASLNFAAPEKRRYAYKLEGFDKEWNEVGEQRVATYTNLDPGHYVFKVRSEASKESDLSHISTIDLVITPPFWMTVWFKLLLSLTIVGGAGGFYLVRINAIKAQRKALQVQVRERTGELVQSTFMERKAREEAEKARNEAEHANKAKSVFLATMSHEIRTPMNGVIGMASLLCKTSLSTEQKLYAETISTCGDALLTVINDILDFSKIESGNIELEQKDFELRTCIEEVLDLFADKASAAGIDLVYQVDYKVPPHIIGDSLRLRQVLINLVSNAIKFTSKGEVFILVELAQAEKDSIELSFKVRDTGIGIPADKIERLFKAFSQVDSSTTRKYGGTGLGLVICEKLIKLMGGEIKVNSIPGEGSSFDFTMMTAAGKQAARTYVNNNIEGFAGKKVLVVDDNQTNRTILQKQLEELRLIPTLAASGKKAMEILMLDPLFDLVLTDMQMPEMDGIELAELIRKTVPRIPIFLLSSVGDDRNKQYPGLFSAVLTKPIKHQALCRHVMNELRKFPALTIVEPAGVKNKGVEFAGAYPLRILLAEDNLINQLLALKVLGGLGYEVSTVENGQEALDLLSTQSFDIVLMDVQMPEMDGLEATRQIRLGNYAQPVIIAMTANAMQGDEGDCLRAGMDDYLSKPVKPEIIEKMIEKWALKLGRKAII